MSKDQQADHLMYGQGILISGFTTGGEDLGFLTAKGFADTMALFETYKNILYFKNYRNTIFQIVPAANFELNDELRKLRQIYNQENANMKILAARSASEAEQFDLGIKGKKGKQVCFGDLVIFKHSDSDTYLSGTIEPSSGTNGAFLVEVTKELKQILIFKVLPYRSYERIGMPIPFDSPVKLQNVQNNGFLTYQKIGIEKMAKNLDLDKKSITADESYVIPVKTNSSQSQIYECVTHFMDLSRQPQNQNSMPTPMPWRFQLHIRDIDVTDSLIQHDIIYFQHTENNGILSTKGKEIILKEMKEGQGDELPFYECLWEVQKHDLGQDAYILRHLMSGMTLGIKKDANGDPIKAELFDISEGLAQNNLGYVDLRLAKKEIADIDSGSYINICYNDWCLDKVKSEDEAQGEEQEQKSDDFISIPKLNKLAVNQLEYEVKKVKFTIEISKNCFMIKQIEDDLKKQCLFALSFHAKIIDLREDLKWGWKDSQEKIKYRRLMQVTEKIKEIKDFLKNCKKEDSDLQYIRPIFKRQMICKDLGISELLFELLYYMKKNFADKYAKVPEGEDPLPYIYHKEPNEWGKFWQLYNAIYEVIYELVRDNLLFKIFVSKWINFVIEDVLVENETSHLKLLKELFKNNEFVVKNFVDSVLIQKLSNKMLGQKQNYKFVEIKYLEIFRLFTRVGNTVNTSNQMSLLQKFIKTLKKTKTSEYYQITVSKQSVENSNKKEIFTEAAIDKNETKKRRFNDYKKICKEEYQTAWFYFVEYINLVADMTVGRNKLVEDYIKGMFSVDILTDLFLYEELEEAEPPIVRLLHNLYIESQPYYSIEKNKRISDFDDPQKKQDAQKQQIDIMNAKKTQPWKAKSLMKILNGVLQKLGTYGPINPSQTLRNECLYQYLSFIWQTLNLGFWQKKQNIKDILNEILRILEPHPSVSKNYAQSSIQSKQNSLMMNCKQECMNIIQLVLDYDLDLSVRSTCKFFKDFKIPQKKRTLQIGDGTRLTEQRIDDQLANKFILELPRDDKINLVQLSIIPIMVELSKYNNPRLTSGSISIIERVLTKSTKAIESFCRQSYVCGDDRLALKNTIEEHKDKFYIMQDQTLQKIKDQNDQPDNYVSIYKEDLNPANAGIMQVINMMSEVIKNQVDIKDVKQYMSLEANGLTNLLGEDTLINFTDQRNSSNYMKQSVLDAQNIHLKVLEFVLNCTEIPADGTLSKKLLHLSYKFLVSLVWNNQHAKPTLISYLPDIQHHLRKNVGSIDFLKEMYDNNKTLLFNQVNVRKLIKEICLSINSEPEGSYYKSKLLDFFRFLIYCNGKSLKNNQILILKIMQDDSFQNINLNIDTAMIRDLVRDYNASFEIFEKETKNNKKVKIDPKLVYLITYFQILESLIDDKCGVNMGKLKKRYPFEKLLEWLRESDKCWPLKRNIRCFLNRLFYFEPQIQVYMKQIVDKQLDNIINDLNGYITIKAKETGQFQNYRFENPIRFTYLESYLYLNLQENLFTLYMLATDKKISQEMKGVLHPIEIGDSKGPKNFIRICERLGWIKNYFTDVKNTYTNSFIKFLLNRFEAVISEFNDDIYETKVDLPGGQKRAPMKSEKETARKGLIAKIMRGDIGTYFVQDDPLINDLKPLVYRTLNKVMNPKEERKPNNNKLLNKLRQILRREKKPYKNKDDEIDYKLSRLVRAIKLSAKGKELLSKEYNQKLNNSAQGDSVFQYITIIIQMNSKDKDALPSKEKKFFLNLITGIVDQTNTVEREFMTIDLWESDNWVADRQIINFIQNRLKLCKLGTFITQLLKQPIWQNVQFADSILLCGIAYMFGGFTNTQKDMIETIKADKDNKVMRNLQSLISKLGEFIVKSIEEGSKRESDNKDIFSITTIDNYDFYQFDQRYVNRKNVFEPQTTDQEIYTLTCIRTYQRAFKFLQLLCENNNIDGKKFIQDQKNPLKNFDFIKIAVKEIRNIFMFLSPDIHKVSLFLLDFLLQVTQIPVKLNQDALLNLTFFEDICALHNSFYNKPDYVLLKGFDGKQDKLDQIFEKGIMIILSCFEGNEPKTFRAIDNKLEPKFLTNILTDKLKQMGLTTKQSAINYIDRLTTPEFDTQMNTVLNIIIIFLKLKQQLGDDSRVYSMYKNQKKLHAQLFDFLEKNLLKIEIINGGVPQMVIFPKYPVFNSLGGGLRDTVMNSVERSTHRDKIVSLQGYTSAIKSKIQSSYTLLKSEKITEKHMNDAFTISAVMSIVVCIYMMLYYDVIINYGEADFEAPRIVGLGRFGLSLIQLSMALVYFYYWLTFKIWENPERKARVDNSPVLESEGEDENKIVKAVKDKVFLISDKLMISKIVGMLHAIVKGGDTTQPLYLSAQFWRVAIYVIVSFVGTFFYPPLYFIHIMDIFCYNPQIGNIFKAIGLNFSELMYVSFMGVVFAFVFCTVTFSNYMKNVYSGDEPQSDLCQTMMECIMQLYVSGAIGQSMQTFEIVRFSYDTIYGIFFGTMLSNIISGIMLDAFGSLRDQTNQLQRDKENLCYICNVTRQTLQKQKITFSEHINGSHFLWNYVFFVYYLDKKSSTDYSGLEYLITAQYNQTDEDMQIDWVPAAKSQKFDSAGMMKKMNALVDEKQKLLENSASEVEDSLKKLREILQ